MNRNLVLGITGASGAPYVIRLLRVLLASGHDVHLSISPAGQAVIKQELDLVVNLDNFQPAQLLPDESDWTTNPKLRSLNVHGTIDPDSIRRAGTPAPKTGVIHYHHFRDLMAPIASGSFVTSGMIVCPCSGGTLSAIAHGASENLIHRAADVHLKEGRKLILVPRETPLSLIQLDNMRRVVEAGATLLPAMPGFYHGVQSLTDLIDFIVCRVCDQLGIEQNLMRRWGE